MTYNTVIVAVEPNEEARRVIERATSLCKPAQIQVVTVVQSIVNGYGPMGINADEALASAVNRMATDARAFLTDLAASMGIPKANVTVRIGYPVATLHELAHEFSAQCIIAGHHGQQGLQLLFGSTANALIHGLGCDAYFVPVPAAAPINTSTKPGQTIIVAVDAQAGSEQVLESARAIAAPGDQLHLVTVVKPVAYTYAGFDMANVALPSTLDEEAVAQAEQELALLKKNYDVSGQDQTQAPPMSFEVRKGVPSQEIRGTAEQFGSRLIVTGSHGRRGLARLLGSTANAILHGAKTDVLVVKIDA